VFAAALTCTAVAAPAQPSSPSHMAAKGGKHAAKSHARKVHAKAGHAMTARHAKKTHASHKLRQATAKR
jgi:hypothetical protein